MQVPRIGCASRPDRVSASFAALLLPISSRPGHELSDGVDAFFLRTEGALIQSGALPLILYVILHRAAMPQTPASPEPAARQSYVGAWVVSLLLIVIYVFGLLLYPPVFHTTGDAPKVPDGVLFIGRFHPILVHLPIGALMLQVLFEILCMTRRGEARFGATALLTLIIGSAGAVAGVLAGIMLSREGGYEGGNFTLHQGIGVGATAGILIALTLRVSAMGSGHDGVMDCYRILFFLSFAFLGLGAHFGGNMSHGNKFLTEFAPPALRDAMVGVEKWMLGLVEKPKGESDAPKTPAPAATPEVKKDPASAPSSAPPLAPPSTPAPSTPPAATDGGNVAADDSKLVFHNVVLPVLEAKCNKCHNEAKSKGDLRMDTHELALKGGKEEPGKTIIAGKADESLAITRIKLPTDDDDHMPPEGKDQMTPEETELLHWWIQEGASNTLKVKDAKFPEKIKPLVESLLKK